MATRKPKILTSPAKGAKRTAKQWSAAFRATKPLCEQERRQCKTWDPINATCSRAECPLHKPLHIDMETRSAMPLSLPHGDVAGPGVIGDPTRRSVSHNVQHKAGGMFINGSLMGANEYATLPRVLAGALADYCVREGTDGKWGIYTRGYNVRVATFAAGSACIRDMLHRTFEFALTSRLAKAERKKR